jgi:beta-xylosidase
MSTAYPEFGPKGGNSTVWQAKLDLTTGYALTQPEMIYRSSLPENIRWAEGPHIYLINGTYYLSVAEGGTEVLHRQTIHRGPSPSGPWEASPLGPLVFNSRDPSAPIQQTGHADIFQRPDGSWYTVFLAVRPQLPQNLNGTYQLGRETFLSPVTWSQDGWPLANHGKLITLDMEDSSLPSNSNASHDLHEDFSGSSLQLGWEFRGTPFKPWWRVENNSLSLRGTVATLDALDGMALVLRKQDALFYTFSVDMTFDPTMETQEAGIVTWVNDHYHDTVSVVQCQDGSNSTCLKTLVTVGVRNGDDDGNTTTTYYPLPSQASGNGTRSAGAMTVRLSIRTTPETYQLGYSLPQDNTTTWLTAYTAAWMAPHYEGRISWQGARMGMYATGNGIVMLNEAVFRNVEIMKGPY